MELGEDVRDVVADGLGADVQTRADLAVVEPFGDEAEDVAFPVGEVGERADRQALALGVLGWSAAAGSYGSSTVTTTGDWAFTRPGYPREFSRADVDCSHEGY